jgi:small neutral amino acid transporter SnatA (MarC family)
VVPRAACPPVPAEHGVQAAPWRRVLRKRGMVAIQRLSGMLLTTVAVQMFLSGADRFLSR